MTAETPGRALVDRNGRGHERCSEIGTSESDAQEQTDPEGDQARQLASFGRVMLRAGTDAQQLCRHKGPFVLYEQPLQDEKKNAHIREQIRLLCGKINWLGFRETLDRVQLLV